MLRLRSPQIVDLTCWHDLRRWAVASISVCSVACGGTVVFEESGDGGAGPTANPSAATPTSVGEGPTTSASESSLSASSGDGGSGVSASAVASAASSSASVQVSVAVSSGSGSGGGICGTGVETGRDDLDACLGESCCPEFQACASQGPDACEACFADGGPLCDAAIACIDANPCDNTCFPDEFRCHSGECLPLKERCDGFESCFDGSDERECG